MARFTATYDLTMLTFGLLINKQSMCSPKQQTAGNTSRKNMNRS